MLRIPSPGDPTPTLVVPIKGRAPERDPEAEAEVKERQKHRRKRSRKSKDHSWDRNGSSSRESLREERRQMFWMLLGGGTLFALIISAVLIAMLGSDDKPSKGVAAAPPPPITGGIPETGETPAIETDTWDQAAFLAAAEPLAARFLDARNTAGILPMVRNPEIAGPRIAAYYPGGVIEPVGMTGFSIETEVDRIGSLSQVIVRTGDFEDRTMVFSGNPSDLRIDWESWVGWSEMPWVQFQREKPNEPKLFRVILSSIDYYNFAFEDEDKFRSFRLESPDGTYSMYGYAERASVLESRLRPNADVTRVPLTLMLKYPEQAASPNQVWIDKVVADGWALDQPPP